MPTPDRYLDEQRRAWRDERRAVFGARLRQLRQARGLTQEGLANAVPMDRKFLVNVERGHAAFMVDRAYEVAAALGVQAHELFLPPVEDEGTGTADY